MATEDEKDQNAGKTTPPDAGGNGGAKTFTQEQLDAIVADRAKRAEESALKKHYESLGVKDESELAALVKAQRDADAKNKTELQKATDDAAKAKAEVDKVKAEADLKLSEANKRLLDSEIKREAGRTVLDKEGKPVRLAFRPEAIDDIPVLINREGIKDENGKYLGIEEALAALAKAKPFLLVDGKPEAGKGTPKPKLPGKPGESTEPAKPAWTL